MFTAETVVAASLSFIVMLALYYFARARVLHMGGMALIVIFDILMPFYLVLNRDWKERLIDGGEIFSFLIWMHLGLVIALYALYVMQIQAARGILAGDGEARLKHHGQGKAILLTRFLVIFSGALLYEPEGLEE